jgi:hypothetical protein
MSGGSDFLGWVYRHSVSWIPEDKSVRKRTGASDSHPLTSRIATRTSERVGGGKKNSSRLEALGRALGVPAC